MSEDEKKLARNYRDLVANFIRNGNPNQPNESKFLPFNESHEIIHIQLCLHNIRQFWAQNPGFVNQDTYWPVDYRCKLNKKSYSIESHSINDPNNELCDVLDSIDYYMQTYM